MCFGGPGWPWMRLFPDTPLFRSLTRAVLGCAVLCWAGEDEVARGRSEEHMAELRRLRQTLCRLLLGTPGRADPTLGWPTVYAAGLSAVATRSARGTLADGSGRMV